MKLVKYAVLGSICLALVDKWLQLGFIWPESSEKPPFRSRSVSYLHPSVTNRSDVASFADYQAWYRRQWSAE